MTLQCTSDLNVQEHYGKSSPEAVAAVKALYRDMGLEQVFFDYEQASAEPYLLHRYRPLHPPEK